MAKKAKANVGDGKGYVFTRDNIQILGRSYNSGDPCDDISNAVFQSLVRNGYVAKAGAVKAPAAPVAKTEEPQSESSE